MSSVDWDFGFDENVQLSLTEKVPESHPFQSHIHSIRVIFVKVALNECSVCRKVSCFGIQME